MSGTFRQWADASSRFLLDRIVPTWERRDKSDLSGSEERLVLRVSAHCDVTADAVVDPAFATWLAERTQSSITVRYEDSATGSGASVDLTPDSSSLDGLWHVEEKSYAIQAPGVALVTVTWYWFTDWITIT